MRQELSLDQLWLVQLGAWFADLARFDLGVSLAPGERAIDKLGIELGQGSLIQKRTVAARQMAERKVWAAVVAHGDAAPVLDAAEHVLDAMALAIECLVVGDRDLPSTGRGNAGGDAEGDEWTSPGEVESAQVRS